MNICAWELLANLGVKKQALLKREQTHIYSLATVKRAALAKQIVPANKSDSALRIHHLQSGSHFWCYFLSSTLSLSFFFFFGDVKVKAGRVGNTDDPSTQIRKYVGCVVTNTNRSCSFFSRLLRNCAVLQLICQAYLQTLKTFQGNLQKQVKEARRKCWEVLRTKSHFSLNFREQKQVLLHLPQVSFPSAVMVPSFLPRLLRPPLFHPLSLPPSVCLPLCLSKHFHGHCFGIPGV